MIVKVKGGYVVMSHEGKKLSGVLSQAGAHKRLAEIEYFKKQGK